MRDDDLVARIGGDELLIVMPGIHSLEEAVKVTDTLRRILDAPVPFESTLLHSSVSIGVTLTHDDDTPDSVIARADTAMYQAKEQGNRLVGSP